MDSTMSTHAHAEITLSLCCTTYSRSFVPMKHIHTCARVWSINQYPSCVSHSYLSIHMLVDLFSRKDTFPYMRFPSARCLVCNIIHLLELKRMTQNFRRKSEPLFCMRHCLHDAAH